MGYFAEFACFICNSAKSFPTRQIFGMQLSYRKAFQMISLIPPILVNSTKQLITDIGENNLVSYTFACLYSAKTFWMDGFCCFFQKATRLIPHHLNCYFENIPFFSKIIKKMIRILEKIIFEIIIFSNFVSTLSAMLKGASSFANVVSLSLTSIRLTVNDQWTFDMPKSTKSPIRSHSARFCRSWCKPNLWDDAIY